jgi:hypothetical protein
MVTIVFYANLVALKIIQNALFITTSVGGNGESKWYDGTVSCTGRLNYTLAMDDHFEAA